MTIFDKLQFILSRQLGIHFSHIKSNTAIKKLGVEEMEIMEFKLAIELAFGVRIPFSLLAAMYDLEELVGYIQKNKTTAQLIIK